MKQLAELFHDRLSDFHIANNSSSVLLSANDLPGVPPVVLSNSVRIQKRERYLPNGKIDNLVMELDRPTSTALGLWIVAFLLDETAELRSIRLSDEAEVNEIRIIKYRKKGTERAITSFHWTPKVGKEAIPRVPSEMAASVRLTNEADDWFDESGYQQRNVLLGFGGPHGAAAIATFFLNFGLPNNDVNYESLNHRAEPANLLDENSCELRIQIN